MIFRLERNGGIYVYGDWNKVVFSLRVNEDPGRRLVIRPVEGCYIGKPRGEDLEYCMNGQFSVDVESVIPSRLVCQ